MRNTIVTLLLVATSFSSLFAQGNNEPKSVYSILLGAFENAKATDFELIRSYAYVYEKDGEVFVGNFQSEEKADEVLAKVRAKGFDAELVEKDLAGSEKVFVVQIATQLAGNPINWAVYNAVSADLYSSATEDKVRLMVGKFSEIGEARAKANELREMGFTDAFAIVTRENAIAAVTNFDKAKTIKGQKKPQKPKKIEKIEKKDTPKEYETQARPTEMESSGEAYAGTRRKTSAATELQRSLKDGGAYSGVVDGVFGKGTGLAYEQALKRNKRLRKYYEESKQYQGFGEWEDARLLVTIAHDLNTQDNPSEITADLLNNLPTKALFNDEKQNTYEWDMNMLNNLNTFGKKSTFNGQIANALKVAYFRTQMHLEAYYSNQGMSSENATPLAIAVIRTLVGEDLDNLK